MKYLVELVDSSLFENKEIEYKLKLEADPDKIEKWAKTLVGFSNSGGGILFVGVSDEGLAIGLSKKEIDNTKNLVLKVINRHIFPHIEVLFHVMPCDKEKYVLSIYADYVNEMVVYKSGDYNEKVYLREDGATIPATISQILAMGKRKFGIDNQLLNEQYNKTDYTAFHHLAKVYRADQKELTEEMLISKEILGADGRVTQGLKMFSDKYDSDDTLIVCRLWNGYDKGVDEVIDKKEFSGSICNTFTFSMDFIQRNSRSGFIKRKDGSRFDTASYPEQSLREALVNAIAHRDYSIGGTQIDVDIYKDRLEIVSPGNWLLSKKPSDYPLNRIPSVRRNKIICNCFEAVGLMEKSGSGLGKIYNQYNAIGGKEPTLIDEGDFFSITLYDLLADKEEAFTVTGKYDKQILDFCDGVARTRDEIQAHIGYTSRSHLMQDVIKPLVSSGNLILTAPAKSKNVRYITRRSKN